MDKQVIINKLEELKERIAKLWLSFDMDKKNQEIKKLETEMSQVNFWNNKDAASKLVENLGELKTLTNSINNIKKDLDESLELIAMDVDLDASFEGSVQILSKQMDELELSLFLSGDYDKGNVFLEIHSGAGGTEACDWAEMLFRMYSRYCDKHDYKYDILDYQPGEEAGIKMVTMHIKGKYSFGYLKYEKGIHRLVQYRPLILIKDAILLLLQ